jgi:hypothetical protein
MTTAVRPPLPSAVLDVVWITPQDGCAPSAIPHDATMPSFIRGFRQTIAIRVLRLLVARDLARPVPDFTASRHSQGIEYP